MFVIPVQLRSGAFDVLIVVGDQNVERIREHDPLVLEVRNLPERYQDKPLRNVIVTYETEDDTKKLIALLRDQGFAAAAAFAFRGFRHRPELGDGEPWADMTNVKPS